MPSSATQTFRAPSATERVSELTTRLEEEFRTGLDRARREVSEQFNRAIRRLARSGARNEWAAALLDAAVPFASRAALFMIAGSFLRGMGVRGLADDAPPAVEVPLSGAPAFANAATSRETVAALRSAAEISETLAMWFEPAPGARCWLIPIVARERVIAVLYADGDESDVNGLEAVAALAGATFRSSMPMAGVPAPEWSELSREEQALHLRAQRFARVRIAGMRLDHAPAVRAGRANKTLYAELKQAIDSGRDAFRREFLSASSFMPDYFHWELVRTLANDDVSVLGEDYPGAMA